MLSCQQATALAAQGFDTPLSLWQRLQLKLHLLVCSRCRQFCKQLAFVHEAWQISAQQQHITLSVTARARIAARLASAQAEQKPPPSAKS